MCPGTWAASHSSAQGRGRRPLGRGRFLPCAQTCRPVPHPQPRSARSRLRTARGPCGSSACSRHQRCPFPAGLGDAPQAVLQAIRGYVRTFFGCRECGEHFEEMAKESMAAVETADQAMLWLWRKHNLVNGRLAGERAPRTPPRGWGRPALGGPGAHARRAAAPTAPAGAAALPGSRRRPQPCPGLSGPAVQATDTPQGLGETGLGPAPVGGPRDPGEVCSGSLSM